MGSLPNDSLGVTLMDYSKDDLLDHAKCLQNLQADVQLSPEVKFKLLGYTT